MTSDPGLQPLMGLPLQDGTPSWPLGLRGSPGTPRKVNSETEALSDSHYRGFLERALDLEDGVQPLLSWMTGASVHLPEGKLPTLYRRKVPIADCSYNGDEENQMVHHVFKSMALITRKGMLLEIQRLKKQSKHMLCVDLT